MDAWIGLGSNLENPLRQVKQAFRALAKLSGTRLLAQSSCYRSRPLSLPGETDESLSQPYYINAVARIDTTLAAEALLDALQAIERHHGRRREDEDGRWRARTLDLDLLLYGDECIATPRLTVPHPGLAEREFVLYPLTEIAPGLRIPVLSQPGVPQAAERTLEELVRACPRRGLLRLESTRESA